MDPRRGAGGAPPKRVFKGVHFVKFLPDCWKSAPKAAEMGEFSPAASIKLKVIKVGASRPRHGAPLHSPKMLRWIHACHRP